MWLLKIHIAMLVLQPHGWPRDCKKVKTMTHLYVTYSETVWKQWNENVFGLLLGKNAGKMIGKEGSNDASHEDCTLRNQDKSRWQTSKGKLYHIEISHKRQTLNKGGRVF